jgi:tRNA nucleotidyltransferase (CCA-adding enzyme)
MITIPRYAERLINALNKAGYEAYVVGGCVRDSLLNQVPKDWDITTSATPDQVKEVCTGIFGSTVIPTGEAFGTVTVLIDYETYEVTTYRIDGKYSDSRHPDDVQYVKTLAEDLSRRDFTINAMAYHPKHGLIDLYGGQEDLANRRINCVGKAEDRFREDPLRMLRAIRFAARLEFTLSEDILFWVELGAPQIAQVSGERIMAEVSKIVTSSHPEYIRWARYLLWPTIPEFSDSFQTTQNNPYHKYNVGEHTLVAMQNIPPSLTLRLVMFFHDLGKITCKSTDAAGINHFYKHSLISENIVHRVATELKFSNELRNDVAKLVKYHDTDIIPEVRWIRKYISKVGKETVLNMFHIRRADILAQSDVFKAEQLRSLDDALRIYMTIRDEKPCLAIKDLAINGGDLLELGYRQGPGIGKVLAILLDKVIQDPTVNTRNTLLNEANYIKDLLNL